MTSDQEVKDVVTTSTEDGEFVELGEVSVETKGGSGSQFLDGGPGWYL